VLADAHDCWFRPYFSESSQISSNNRFRQICLPPASTSTLLAGAGAKLAPVILRGFEREVEPVMVRFLCCRVV
jgi:hypothetical protein